jgi:flagellar hook-length control protein FliK
VATSNDTASKRDASSYEAPRSESASSPTNAAPKEDDSETDSTTPVEAVDQGGTESSEIASQNEASDATGADDSVDEEQVNVNDVAAVAVEAKVATAADVKAASEVDIEATEVAAKVESGDETADGDRKNGRTPSSELHNNSANAALSASTHADSNASAPASAADKGDVNLAPESKSNTRGNDSEDRHPFVSSDEVITTAEEVGVAPDATQAAFADESDQSKVEAVVAVGEVSDETKPKSENDESDKSANSTVRQRGIVEAVVNKVAAAAISTEATSSLDNGKSNDSNEGSKTTKAAAPKGIDAAVSTNRIHSNARSVNRGAQAAGAEEPTRIDPARFVGRVAKALQTANERGGPLQLRLSPPELGAMRIELTVKEGVMTANLETENAAAKRVLLEHLPALRERLAEQNIRVERFDVDVRREGAGSQADPRAPQDQQQSQHGHTNRRSTAERAATAQPARVAVPMPQQITTNTGINVVA